MGTSTTEAQRDFTVIVERDEDGHYVASVPALAGCHTQARSLDELGPIDIQDSQRG
jgi:hypothetical protein